MAGTAGFWHWNRLNKRTGGINKFIRLSSASRQLGHSSPSSTTISNKLVSEAFWPSTVDKESDKAEKILYSFCKYGMYQDESRENSPQAIQKQKAWIKVPEDVIASAKGLVIFTAMRAGLWVSGAGGSGVIVARTPDGSWSWPVAIEIHTAELGFLLGVDIYDCLLVLNTVEAVEAFSKSRCIIGGDLYATPGPLSVGWFFGTDTRSKQSPIFSYLRSRGYYAAVQLDHAFVVERSEENKKFYDSTTLSAKDVLSGSHELRPSSCAPLLATLRSSEGKPAPSDTVQPAGPPPSDFEVVEEGHAFGVPDRDDPDPFGVYALEKQGFQIKEAGTKTSPTQESFEFNPSISSPVYDRYNRRSTENLSSRTSWRRSVASTIDRHETASVASNHTDQDSIPPSSPRFSNPRLNPPRNDQGPLLDGQHNNLDSISDHTVVNGTGSSSQRASLLRSAKSAPGPQTIYEDRSLESNNLGYSEFEATDSIMDRMVNLLQNQDEAREKSISSNSKHPLHIRSVSSEQVGQKPSAPWTEAGDSRTKNLSNSEIDASAQNKPSGEESQAEKDEGRDGEVSSVADEKVDKLEAEVNDSDNDEYFSDLDEEPESPVVIQDAVIQGGPAPISQSVANIIKPKARIVTVTKPTTPSLPQRNPGRLRPSSVTPSLEERSQMTSSADPESAQSSNKDEKSSTELSSPASMPEERPNSPISLPTDAEKSKRPVSESHLKQPNQADLAKRLSLDTNITPRPNTANENVNPDQTTSLANLRQDLEVVSPSPDTTSPGFDKEYFS